MTTEPPAKRMLMNNQPLFISLPYHLQFMIIKTMNLIDARCLSHRIPYISSIVDKIKWDNINYNNDTKNEMIIKAFESSNISVVEELFRYIKYTDIEKINIDNETFIKIIEICYNNKFIKGIEFLNELKNNHYINYKNHVDNNYQLISQYIKINTIEPRKIFLNLIISNNNIDLLKYINNNYSYDFIMNFNNYKDKLLPASIKHNMIKLIKYRLITMSISSDSANYYYNTINSLCRSNNMLST
jgi:hypothetical protein